MKIYLNQAIEQLLKHQVIAIPTETVWGLAASLESESAIETIFEIKKRPPKNPLIIHLSESREIFPFLKKGALPDGLIDLMDSFWPGPLTVVVPIDTTTISPVVRANLRTAAFRVPKLRAIQELIQAVGPLVAPSANISGKPSSTRAFDVESDFGKEFPCFFPEGFIDSGTEFGIESTILVWDEALSVWSIGRLGSLSLSSILNALPKLPLNGTFPKKDGSEETPICPGQLFRHYSPEAKLFLGGDNVRSSEFEAIIGFSDRKYEGTSKIYYLGDSQSPWQALHNLYKILRELDRDSVASAWVDISFPADQEVWCVLYDRLLKASS
ncbi:MAG: L-threonylcarbamoyladenylate synthase [Chlamydia sp.]